MEIQTAPSVWKSTLRPSRQKYKAASFDKQPIWQQQPRTLSSKSGAPRNRTVRHARSSISNPASTPVPFRRRLCHAYINTRLKYHGHRWRRDDNATRVRFSCHEARILFFLFSEPHFRVAPSERSANRTHHRRHTKEARGIAHKGILRWSSSMIVIPVLTYPHVACPWIGHVK